MEFVVASVVTIAVVAISGVCLAEEKWGRAAAFGFPGIMLFIGLVFVAYDSGISNVPNSDEEFTRRLEEGEVYQLIASHTDGADTILLVMEKDSKNYYAIRVNSGQVPLREPRYFFTLIKGQLAELK